MPRWLLVLCLAGLTSTASAEPEALSVKGSFGEAWVSRDEPIALELSRPLAQSEGRLAVLIGATDVTGLFRVTEKQVTYDAAVPLPPGENDVVVQLVTTTGEWREVARMRLRVLTERGFRTARATPTLTAGVKAQFAENHTPDSNIPPRETFQDLTLQGQLATEHAREGWSSRTTLGIAGTTYAPEALRFGQRGEEAPKLDLSGYSLELTRGRSALTVGDVTFGHQRYLVDSFASRGTQYRVGVGGRADATLVAMNGSRIVGWDNLVGLGRPEHRILAGAVGLELLPQAGALRVEVSGVDGSVLPEASYNQGLVNDAAEGRGFGLRAQAKVLAQRLRVEAGLAWSDYGNPPDPQLEQGLSTVTVATTSRAARFAAASLDVLHNHAVTPSRPATLTATFQHDRVDPLFASVAAVVRGDLETNTYGVNAALGEVMARVSRTRSEDNLDDVASILKTLTHRDVVDARLPVATFRAGAVSSPWLPVLTYTMDRTRQFGAGIPVNSDFSASHVPDQLSLSHVGTVTWAGERHSITGRVTRSTQDNRQIGRENADFRQATYGANVSFTPRRTFNLGMDVSFEKARSQETSREDRLQRFGLNVDWRAWRSFGVSSVLGFTRGDDDVDSSLKRNTELDAQAFWLFRPRGDEKRPQARLFLRGATQRSKNRENLLSVLDDRSAWQMSAGLSVNAF